MENKLFEYRFITKHSNAFYITIYLVIGLSLSIYGIILNKESMLLGLGILWLVLIPLILLSSLAEIRSKILYSPIEVTNEGIKVQLRNDKHEYFPKKDIQFLEWSSLNNYEFFKFPDSDSTEGLGKKGVRLWSGNKKIVIFESIRGYDSLLKIIQNKLPRGR